MQEEQQQLNFSFDPLLRVQRVAEVLDVAPITIWRWIRAGKVRTIRLGKAVRIPESELRRIASDGFEK